MSRVVSGRHTVVVLPAADRAAVPWLNGGGQTAEIAVRAFDGGSGGAAGRVGRGGRVERDFDWRLSIATIAGDGEFSPYPGIDRALMPISPGGLDLLCGAKVGRIEQYDVHLFSGEQPVSAANVTGPSLDLNLMTRRGRCSGTLVAVDVVDEWSLQAGTREEVAVVVLDGTLLVGSRRLGPLDAVLAGRGGRLTGRAEQADGSGIGIGADAVAGRPSVRVALVRVVASED